MIPDQIRVIAKAEMTPKQFEAFEMECAGWGLTRISKQLGIARQTVWARIDGAHRALERQGVQQDASGNWYLEGEVLMSHMIEAGSDEHLERIDLQERWKRLRTHLDEQQLQVIVRRYGLEGYLPMTFDEIAEDTGLEVERVKLIDWNTMGLLKHELLRDVWTQT